VSERRCLERAEGKKLTVADDPLRGMADAGKPGCHEHRDRCQEGEQRAAPVRRAPARRIGERGYDHECQAAAGHRRTAEEALKRRSSSTGPHEVEPADERRSRADPDDRARDECKLKAAVDEKQRVAEDARCDGDERD
jgi:hypothetical protein